MFAFTIKRFQYLALASLHSPILNVDGLREMTCFCLLASNLEQGWIFQENGTRIKTLKIDTTKTALKVFPKRFFSSSIYDS